MDNNNECDWCAKKDLEWRTIQQTQLLRSFVSTPWFREGQCLVIPTRHVSSVTELTPDEASTIMIELGRLGSLLDIGYGTGIMQKFMPTQVQNGIKMNHLHFHVFPRFENEEGLFPTPYPNDFSAFYKPEKHEVTQLVESLKVSL